MPLFLDILFLSPFNWLPIHPENICCVSTMCYAGTVLDSGEIQLEPVLPGGTERNSEVLGDLTTIQEIPALWFHLNFIV